MAIGGATVSAAIEAMATMAVLANKVAKTGAIAIELRRRDSRRCTPMFPSNVRATTKMPRAEDVDTRRNRRLKQPQEDMCSSHNHSCKLRLRCAR
jgi:hypothetical protein